MSSGRSRVIRTKQSYAHRNADANPHGLGGFARTVVGSRPPFTLERARLRAACPRARASTARRPRRLQGVTLYRETERAFAAGDRVQMTAPDRDRGVPNRELGTVERVDANGRMEIRWD